MKKITIELTDEEYKKIRQFASDKQLKSFLINLGNRTRWVPDTVGTVAGEGSYYLGRTPLHELFD